MSESQQRQSQQQRAIRGGPFSIVQLNRILDFATATPAEAILGYGLVCRQWREAMYFYCELAWTRLARNRWGRAVRMASLTAFPDKDEAHAFFSSRLHTVMTTVTSAYAFEQRARADIKRTRPAHDVMEIENCGGGMPAFRFRCPLISAGLRLSTEVSDVNGLRKLFCDVCNQHVTPVQSAAELEQLRKTDKGACIVIPRDIARLIRGTKEQRKELKVSKGNHDNNNDDDEDDDSSSSRTTPNSNNEQPPISLDFHTYDSLVNIAIVTDQPAPAPNDVHAVNNDRAIQVLRAIASDSRVTSKAHSFFSRELLIIQGNLANARLHIAVVRIPPFPTTTTTKSTTPHPCAPDQPLGKFNEPTISGWNMFVLVKSNKVNSSDSSSSNIERWFELEAIPQSLTRARAVVTSRNVIASADVAELADWAARRVELECQEKHYEEMGIMVEPHDLICKT